MGMMCLKVHSFNLTVPSTIIQWLKILLASVPQSRDPYFEVVHPDAPKRVFRKSKLLVFIQLSPHSIHQISKHSKRLNTRQYLDLKTLWMDVFTAFSNQTPDTSTILRFQYFGGYFVVGNRRFQIYYIMDESVLTYSMRRVAYTELNLSNEIGDLVRSRGGLEHRSFHSIGFGKLSSQPRYRRLTLDQSERLRHASTQPFSFEGTGGGFYRIEDDGCISDEEPWPATPDAEAEKAVNLLIEHMACENCFEHRVQDKSSVPDGDLL